MVSWENPICLGPFQFLKFSLAHFKFQPLSDSELFPFSPEESYGLRGLERRGVRSSLQTTSSSLLQGLV